jgi:predicted amidohydrolase
MEGEGTQPQRRNLKALLCQIKPIYKNKTATIQRITVSLEKYSKKDQFDLILFPEMAFSGYNFSSPADALPYSVKQN